MYAIGRKFTGRLVTPLVLVAGAVLAMGALATSAAAFSLYQLHETIHVHAVDGLEN